MDGHTFMNAPIIFVLNVWPNFSRLITFKILPCIMSRIHLLRILEIFPRESTRNVYQGSFKGCFFWASKEHSPKVFFSGFLPRLLRKFPLCFLGFSIVLVLSKLFPESWNLPVHLQVFFHNMFLLICSVLRPGIPTGDFRSISASRFPPEIL